MTLAFKLDMLFTLIWCDAFTILAYCLADEKSYKKITMAFIIVYSASAIGWLIFLLVDLFRR